MRMEAAITSEAAAAPPIQFRAVEYVRMSTEHQQ